MTTTSEHASVRTELVSQLESGLAAVRPLLRQDLVARGTNDHDIGAALKRGELTALRPGRYLRTESYAEMTYEQRHRLLVASVAPDLKPQTVVSHTSAAVIWGMSLWRVRLDRVHVSRHQAARVRTSRWVQPHHSRTRIPTDVVDDVVVTSPARTVCDCARLLPFEQGVVVADAALRMELVTAAELADEISRSAGLKGVGRARAVVNFADSRSESVGESRSRVMFQTAPLPQMELQYKIDDDIGRFIARVDFAIPRLKIAGEFDGRVKYGRLLRPGQDPGDVVFAEKIREDRAREVGWQMVRWVWNEIEQPAVVIGRWQRAVARAGEARR